MSYEDPKKADIGATHRANGLGELCDEGSYIRICAMWGNDGDEREWFLISNGCAENLRAELEALLEKPRLNPSPSSSN